MVFSVQRDRPPGRRLPQRGWPQAVWRSRGFRRLIVGCAIAVLTFLIAPYVIAPFYRVIDPVSTPMLWRWATGSRVQRTFVPLRRIATVLPITVIMAEDGTFCRNRGIDLAAIREVLRQSDDDVEDSRGASTITQQVAKNLFLWSGHSIVRKVLEIPLALWLNAVLPKRRIMEIYLNIAEWGPNGEFGVEAGSRYAFGIAARDLNPIQAAELTAILPNPSARSARRPGAVVLRLAGLYEQRAATYAARDACLRTP
jgi:monofunctional biosynthetic peptidoglycan transglycosylase